jgi:heat shock protein HspQ
MAFLSECDGISDKYVVSVSVTIQVFGCRGQSLTLQPEYLILEPDLKEVTSNLKPRMYCYTGVHKFF